MTRISLDVQQDGVTVPGFPWQRTFTFRHWIQLQARLTDTLNYTNVIPNFVVTVPAYRVGFLFLVATRDVSIAVADTASPDSPWTLPANMPFGFGGATAAHTNTLPIIRLKATVNPTQLLLLVGLV